MVHEREQFTALAVLHEEMARVHRLEHLRACVCVVCLCVCVCVSLSLSVRALHEEMYVERDWSTLWSLTMLGWSIS